MTNHQRRRNDLKTNIETRRTLRVLMNGHKRQTTTSEKLRALDSLIAHIEARAKEDGYTLTDEEPSGNSSK